MNTNNHFELSEQLEDLDDIPAIRNVPENQLRQRKQTKKQFNSLMNDEMSELAEEENELKFSYGASKHEKVWLI